MSFLTVLTMISLSVPGIAKIIQQILMNFIYMDILQTELWLIPSIFPPATEVDLRISEEDEDDKNDKQMVSVRRIETPLNIYFEENGFNSRVLLKNLGSTTLYLAILILSFILIPFLKCLGLLSSR
jgi:hypothetical protein